MKRIILIFIILKVFVNTTCPQDGLSPLYISSQFERFDFEKFEKYKNPPNKISIEEQPDGTVIEREIHSDFQRIFETPANSYFRIIKIFYSNGNIERKGVNFISDGFEKGVWYYYDEQGSLTDSIDHDIPYKFTFENVLEFAKKQGIEFPLSPIDNSKYGRSQPVLFPPDITRHVDIDTQRPIWILSYFDKPLNRLDIYLDGITGEEIKRRNSSYAPRQYDF